jgi:TPR repeat protein
MLSHGTKIAPRVTGLKLAAWDCMRATAPGARAIILLLVTFAVLRATAEPTGRRGRGHGADLTVQESAAQRDPGAKPAEDSPAEMARKCEAGDVIACVNLAVACDKGSGMKIDKTRAASLYARACELGEPFSCTRGAGLYDDGREMPADRERARGLLKLSVPLYEKACDKLDALACANLADMYANGRGVERDFKRALELRTRSCSVDPQSCLALGNAYYRGEGIPQDLQRAAKFFGKACDGGSPAACFLLASMTERGIEGQGDPKAAVVLYQRACGLGFEPACRDERRLETPRP